MAIRVLIVNEQPAVCMGVRAILEQAQDINLIGVAYCGKEALEKVVSIEPDVLVLACNLPDMSGTTIIEEVMSLELSTRVLVYSRMNDDQQIKHMLAAGAMGYVLTTDEPETLLMAMRTAMQGIAWIDPELMKRITQQGNTHASKLSEREQEVLELLKEGASNAQVADRLGVSTRTVDFHVRNILQKMEVGNRVQAVVEAIRHGWITV